jgi:hypothetical protein
MGEYKFVRGSDILAAAKPDPERPNPYFKTQDERRALILAAFNKEGADGWKYVALQPGLFSDEPAAVLFYKEKKGELYEYRLLRYGDLRKERDGPRLLSEQAQADYFTKALGDLNKDGWILADNDFDPAVYYNQEDGLFYHNYNEYHVLAYRTIKKTVGKSEA